MSMDECAFCKSFYMISRHPGYSDYLCHRIDALLGSRWTPVPDVCEEVFVTAVITWVGSEPCDWYVPAGHGYSHFFRYIYIALKRGRATL